jgi:uncharacterized protein YcbK (DUF882 family)
MITLQELNPKQVKLTPDQDANLRVLWERINKIRAAWAKPMIVTSGFRTAEDQRRIYKDIARRNGSDVVRVPMGSKHLEGSACDILDRDGSLMKWTRENILLLEQVGLWCEDGTNGWVHYQTKPPASGNRFFKP